MKFTTTTTTLATLAAVASAAKDERTFAVLRFNGDGFLTEGPVDPIVNPGEQSTHYHGIHGGSAFSATTSGDDLMSSNCTTAKIANDHSNYWVPSLFFQDPNNGTMQKVPMFYMNVYYFFEPTDDDVVPFPIGLKMMTGDSKARTVPEAGGNLNLDPDNGVAINAVQWTCPRSSYDPPSYPVDSDGSTAGIVDSNNDGSGTGFPLQKCDGYASPLRQDMHFPSCYNPEAGLNDYKNNMKFPSNVGFKQNCPEGWIHTPHIFYEVYWNTPLFDDYWTADGKTQPFVLSTGDATGYSSHGDFIGGWDQDTLQTIIDTCNAGDSGMDQCSNIPGGLSTDNDCKIEPTYGSILAAGQILTGLPIVGDDITGWGRVGTGSSSSDSSSSESSSATTSVVASSSSSTPASTEAAATTTSSVEAQDVSSSAESVPTATSTGGAFIETSSEAPATTATSASTHKHGHGNNHIKTVWDVVTVTMTTTVVGSQPTARAVHRRAPHHTHGYAKRQLGKAGGFAARR
ncbi:hypothetical protein F5Y18DRAFT_211413 [Xylariaceae sp. FL1019]|nr:hypothetical protein F5Y18DRAFT_211413 [Xylariaceae sp. FL1019]